MGNLSIGLIKPSLGARFGRPYRTPAALEPLVFALIAGATSADVHLELFDERYEAVPFDRPFSAVVLTVETYTARRSYQIADEFRRRGVKVILGGFHPTLLPDEAAGHADAVAVGEVEGVWHQILGDLKAGRLADRYHATEPRTPFHLDRRLLSKYRYLPLTLVETSRGCVHDCHFCSVRRFYGDRVRHRPIAEVVAELRTLDRSFIFFVDDNIAADPEHAMNLFQALRPLGLRWISQASLATARRPGFLDAMAESGCFAVILGLESLSPTNLQRMNKDWTLKLGTLESLLVEYRRRGILVYGTFVFGYDDDTPAVIEDTVDFTIAQRLFMANFNILQPFPGTRVYEELAADRRLLYERWWLDAEYRWERPAFRPRRMTVDELAAAVANARQRFGSVGNLLRRACDQWANVADPFRAAVFLASNVVSRLDIKRKTGLRLGFPEPEAMEGTR
ncbi:MAG TPA: radical SAM protein [Candidatus Ozemobacteraceae bacterium]|nr:radical SAM protein [Candidatus Ozemobacteraceae bacterium]